MRSRTELVTTNFIDSEEDETESDDSEEDWRPDSSNRNGKKRIKPKSSRRSKRKSSSSSSLNISTAAAASAAATVKRQKFETATFKDEAESDDGSVSSNNLDQHFTIATTNAIPTTLKQITTPNCTVKDDSKPLSQKVVAEQSMPDKSGVFQLYLYKKDLDKDYRTNSHLCLWRRDGSSLLQKYIRVKTSNSEEFIFTSSSVYSSWDERRRKDFTTIAVKCLKENNRRVSLLNVSDLHSLAEDVIRNKQLKSNGEQIEGENSNDIVDSQEEDDDDDDDDVYAYDDDDGRDAGNDGGDEEEDDSSGSAENSRSAKNSAE